MAKPVHSMIRVFDEAKSLDFYARAFGLEVADHLKFDGFALIYLRHPSSPFEVELTVNFDRAEPYALGDGYGHLAVVVDDVDAEHARFEREKLSPGPLRDFKHDGKTLARFFFATDPEDAGEDRARHLSARFPRRQLLQHRDQRMGRQGGERSGRESDDHGRRGPARPECPRAPQGILCGGGLGG